MLNYRARWAALGYRILLPNLPGHTQVAAGVAAYFTTLAERLAALDAAAVERVGAALIATWRRGGTVFMAGNGGSAATASHFALDLSKTTLGSAGAGPRIRCVALTDNVGLLTAWANDAAYEVVFAEQLRNLAREHDALVLISYSGASPNLLAAARAAHDLKVQVLALTGPDAPLAELADVHLETDGPNAQVVEDLHLAVCHALTCQLREVLAAT